MTNSIHRSEYDHPDPAPARYAWSDLRPGLRLGPLRVSVSAAANERFLRAAGVSHPVFAAGACYPPIAANLTVMLFGRHCAEPVVQTRQRLVCDGRVGTGTPLVVTGEIVARYEKRGRGYVDLHATVATEDDPAHARWTSEVTFTPAATLGAR